MAPSERRLRGALVGLGFIGANGHLPAYRARRDLEIVAVADLSAARRALVPSLLPGAAAYGSAEALLAAEGARLDFLDVATPPASHAALARLGLEHGLHVLCEKPLTTDPGDAEALLALAAERRRVIFPCHNYRHAPVVRAVGEVLRSGRIGRVRSVTLQTFRDTHARGVPEWNPDWRRQRALSGGGIAMDHGSHSFYLAFDWMGGWPTAVTAKLANQAPERWDTEDSCSAVLTFPAGLVQAHLTWTAGVRKVLYALQGERGAITVSDDELEVAVLREGRREGPGPAAWTFERRRVASAWMDASHAGWYGPLLDGFLAAVERGDHAGPEAQAALRCVEVIAAAYRSSAEGCRELPLRGSRG